MGMALRQAKLGVEVVGHDREPEAAGQARKKAAVDQVSWSLRGAVEGAQLVIIATPVLAIKEVLEQIAPYLSEGTVVTDTGSTKADVIGWAEELLPEMVSFVGGHPMAGKEVQGIAHAQPDLFKGATYCIIPGQGASTTAVQIVVVLADVVGARPYFLDATEHDNFVAGVSHLPLLLSSALVSALTRSSSWKDMSRLAATGFKDVSRLASSDPRMSRDICLTNREAVVRWVDDFVAELNHYRALILEDGAELEKEFTWARLEREKWLRRPPPEAEEAATVPIPSFGERMTAMLIGERLARRGQETIRRLEGKDRGD